ncbi:MAG TPA: hypothetical protein PLF26_07800 [Blastocatellia bacterium]|nr:hypothetical protein [Blastocatellia bacterium]
MTGTSNSQRSAALLAAIFVAMAVAGCGPGLASAPAGGNGAQTQEPVSLTATGSARFSDMLTSVAIDRNDPVQMRVLADYGAMFVAGGGAVPPPTVLFTSDAEVSGWQATVDVSRETVGRFSIELQKPAMVALRAAVAEASAAGLSITPRGSDAARRSYAETVSLWKSRVDPALRHWVAAKRITQADAARIRALAPHEQVPEVLELEKKGIWFSTDFSKSILYSVAAPGTSQHLSMLALDVAEFENARVRAILGHHGWFQTVQSDLPHFTYLGVDESELPGRGLKSVTSSGRVFWVPAF